MAVEGSQPFKLGHLVANADLSAHQYKFVKLDSGGVAAVSAVTDKVIGVLQNKPKAGQPCEIVTLGMTKVQADADLAFDDLIATSADGQAQTFTAGTDTTAFCAGRMISDPGAAGELATAIVNCIAGWRGITGI